MSFRARFALIAGGWAVAVTGLVVAIPFWCRGRLPDPLAIHWGVSGSPDRDVDRRYLRSSGRR